MFRPLLIAVAILIATPAISEDGPTTTPPARQTPEQLRNQGKYLERGPTSGENAGFSQQTNLQDGSDALKLDHDRLSTVSGRYAGKKVEAKVNCFAADIDDYRCFVVGDGTLARLDLRAILPKEAADMLQKYCDTAKKSHRNKACTLNIRFLYVSSETQDRVDYSVTEITAEDDTALVVK